jgi:hypothetical protein
LLDGKPRFTKSLGTGQPHRSEPPEAAVVAEWKRQINHQERRESPTRSNPAQDFSTRTRPPRRHPCGRKEARAARNRSAFDFTAPDDMPSTPTVGEKDQPLHQ